MRLIEITLLVQLAEDDGSTPGFIADVLSESLVNDVVQDEVFAGSNCEVMFGTVEVVNATERGQ